MPRWHRHRQPSGCSRLVFRGPVRPGRRQQHLAAHPHQQQPGRLGGPTHRWCHHRRAERSRDIGRCRAPGRARHRRQRVARNPSRRDLVALGEPGRGHLRDARGGGRPRRRHRHRRPRGRQRHLDEARRHGLVDGVGAPGGTDAVEPDGRVGLLAGASPAVRGRDPGRALPGRPLGLVRGAAGTSSTPRCRRRARLAAAATSGRVIVYASAGGTTTYRQYTDRWVGYNPAPYTCVTCVPSARATRTVP